GPQMYGGQWREWSGLVNFGSCDDAKSDQVAKCVTTGSRGDSAVRCAPAPERPSIFPVRGVERVDLAGFLARFVGALDGGVRLRNSHTVGRVERIEVAVLVAVVEPVVAHHRGRGAAQERDAHHLAGGGV